MTPAEVAKLLALAEKGLLTTYKKERAGHDIIGILQDIKTSIPPSKNSVELIGLIDNAIEELKKKLKPLVGLDDALRSP